MRIERPATCHDPARGRQRQFQFRCRRRANRALTGASGTSTVPRPACRCQNVSTSADASSARDGPQDRHEKAHWRADAGQRRAGVFQFCVLNLPIAHRGWLSSAGRRSCSSSSGSTALGRVPSPQALASSESSHFGMKCRFREIAKCCQNSLRIKSYFSRPNVAGTEYRLRHEQNSNHAGLGSPLPRLAHQRRGFGNTVVLFWYDRKAQSLRIA